MKSVYCVDVTHSPPWAAVAIMSESKHEVRVTLMVTVQHDHKGEKKTRKEDEFVSCPAAAQDAVGRTVSTVVRCIVANVSTLSDQFFPSAKLQK